MEHCDFGVNLEMVFRNGGPTSGPILSNMKLPTGLTAKYYTWIGIGFILPLILTVAISSFLTSEGFFKELDQTLISQAEYLSQLPSIDSHPRVATEPDTLPHIRVLSTPPQQTDAPWEQLSDLEYQFIIWRVQVLGQNPDPRLGIEVYEGVPYRTVTIPMAHSHDDPAVGQHHLVVSTAMTPLKEIFGQRRIVNMVALILLIGMVFLTTGYMTVNLIGPIERLNDAVRRFADGDLKSRVDTHTPQVELAHTLTQFNAMAGRLEEQALLKRSFIENLTHDLKTPLVAQARSLDLLADEFTHHNLSEQASLAKSLSYNNRHMLHMVKTLLETYQLDDRQMVIDPEQLPLPERLHHMLTPMKQMAEAQNTELKVDVAEGLSSMYCDERALNRLLGNLVGNALYALQSGGEVKVSAFLSADQGVTVQVEDNGLGIHPDDLARLFDRYFVGVTDNRAISTGLGLAICKALMDAHRGSITAESEVGRYTRFTMTFPPQG